jgi:diguanylate cyclase (GGDEF)-like protein
VFVLAQEHPSIASALSVARVRLGLARHRPLVTAAALAAVVVIGWLDYVLPPSIGLTLAYLVPIVAAGWWTTGRRTTAVAGAAALAVLVTDLASYGDGGLGVVAWNASSRLVIFFVVGLGVTRMRRTQDQLAEATSHLARLVERERTLAMTDALTGLPNFRAFRRDVRAEVARRQRQGGPLVLAYLDLDNFKLVNDLYGHATGDDLLRQVGRLLERVVRPGDAVARVGGDEFAVIFADCGREDAERVAQRLIEAVKSAARPYPRAGVTASVGVACFDAAPRNEDEALSQADDAMYEAKGGGKSRVVTRVLGAAGQAGAAPRPR